MEEVECSRDPGASLVPLPAAAASVLARLLGVGPATRPELSAALGVTKQTVSTAVAELERRALVEETAVQQGPSGRSAVRYGLGRRAGWVLGVELGSSRVRLAAAGLDGTVAAERTAVRPGRLVDRSWPEAAHVAGSTARAVIEELGTGCGPLRGVGVALAEAVPEVRPAARDDPGLRPLLDAAQAPAWIENDVNCAAIAQLRYRLGPPPGSVLHLQLGTGVGAAVVVSGEVVRGARGRAGEVAGLPSPLDGRAETVEEALGAAGLLAAAGHSGGADLAAAIDDLFAAAASGDTAAEAAVRDEARGVARLLRGLVAIVDPEVIVLSGRVGGRPELRHLVAEDLAALGVAAPVAADPLGNSATVLGAAALAASRVVSALTGSR